MKCIFFNTHSQVDEIENNIERLTLIKFMSKKHDKRGQIFKEIEILNPKLKKIDIENLLNEMKSKIYDYNFIKMYTEKYTTSFICEFKNFLSCCESELLSDIQVEKIDSEENLNKKYYKIINPFSVTVTTNCTSDENKNMVSWEGSSPLKITKEQLKKIKKMDTRKELEKMDTREELEKTVLKSLYYLQTVYLTSEELAELKEIYNKYISIIDNLWDDGEIKIRHIIHSLCMLEKIYITNQRFNAQNQLKLKVFKILRKEPEECKITYELLEKELIKCLLFKNKKDYIFNKVSPSFYLTTPLRMSCLSYVETIIMIDELIKEEANINNDLNAILKNSFTTSKEYNKYLSGSKCITDSAISKFATCYLKNTVNKGHCISNLYSIYFKYKEREKLKNNYSDENIYFYERTRVEELIYKENILKNKTLYGFISDEIEAVLIDANNFKENKGKDYIIYLNEEMIVENVKTMSLDIYTDEENEKIKKQYVTTSRKILKQVKLNPYNSNYCLVKFLDIKRINNKDFYTFEVNLIYKYFPSKQIGGTQIYGTEIFTFILAENDFKVIGKVLQINYKF